MELFEVGRGAAVSAWARIRSNERASAIVEYVLLVALIAVVCLVAMKFLGLATSGRLSSVASQVADA